MDDWDRRLANCYLEEYFGDFVFDDHQKFSFFKWEEFDYAVPPIVQLDESLNPLAAN